MTVIAAPSTPPVGSDAAREMTLRLLRDAGIGAGMRVLDVGCGRADVSLLVAQLVGETGQVVGIDHDPIAIAMASDRVRALGVPNIEFEQADLIEATSDRGQFDAIVGRRVLMYLPDPVAVLTQLARTLRPGGQVVFQESDATMVPASLKTLPLHERAHRWMWDTVKREGANLHMGFELDSVFTRSGLIVECVRAEAIVQTPNAHHSTAAIVRAMLSRITQHGVATAAEIDIDSLERRLVEERQRFGATYVGDMVFGAWARKPHDSRDIAYDANASHC